ncbi:MULTISPECIES: ankyrin repeat domain-containing protein [unclassified Wolbachia]|uniref:ankyrin repeat domain-containing protein n=1 Tax=unclassified Wolbachia TaxID=2640676 RepID=UPI0030CA334E
MISREEALETLGITGDLSDHEIIYQVKQQLKNLHNDNIQGLSKKIEACRFLTDGQPGQAEIFSDLVISAIDKDKLDFLELLLKTVKNDDKLDYLNTEGTSGNMPLNFAFGYTWKHESRVKIIALLLEHGANPNKQDREGKSSLHCVVNNSNGVFCHKVTELLLDNRADPNAKDNQGKTLLHYLCEDHIHKSVEIVKLLLRRGADPDLKDNYNKRPADYADHDSKVGQLFGAVDRGKVLLYSGGVVCSTFFSIGCALEAAVGDVRKADKIGFVILAAGTAACALYCAYCAIKVMFFSKPSTEFTKARAEFLNSQSPNPAGAA